MKRILFFTAIMAISLPGTAFAGGVLHNSNLSPEWVRTLTRSASTDGVDIVTYNPAGTTYLKDGLHISLGNQFITKDYSHTVQAVGVDADYHDTKPVFVFPSVFGVYKKGDMAVFGSFTVPAGGGSLDYKDGAFMPPMLLYIPRKAEGFIANYAITLGGAYGIMKQPQGYNMLSFGLGIRGVYGYSTVKATATADDEDYGTGVVKGDTLLRYQESGKGFTGILSVNFKPLKETLVSLRYEHLTSMKFKSEKFEDPLSVDSFIPSVMPVGTTHHKDLPPVIAAGASHVFNELIKVEAAFTYYLNKQADWDGAEKNHKNGWEAGLSVEVKLDKKLHVSAGFLHTIAGAGPDTYDVYKPALDAESVGVGAKFLATPDLDINVGALKTFYKSDKYENALGADVKLNKEILIIAIGVNYRFDM